MMNNTTGVLSRDECGRTKLLDDVRLPPEHPLRLVEGICYPFLLLLCSVGNVLNLLVLKGNKPKTTADVFMMAMAVSDLMILCVDTQTVLVVDFYNFFLFQVALRALLDQKN
jgi:hypothetical protein